MARSGGLCPLLHLIQRRPPGLSWGSCTKRSKERKGPEKGLGVTSWLVPEKRTGQLFSCLPECFQCPLVTISHWCVSHNVRSYDYLELLRDYPVCPAHRTPTTVLWVWHYCHPVCKGGKGNVKQCSSSPKDTQEMAGAGPEIQAAHSKPGLFTSTPTVMRKKCQQKVSWCVVTENGKKNYSMAVLDVYYAW